MRKEEIKWYNVLEIIDTETGEIIKKSEFERRNLRIIDKEKHYEISERNGSKWGISTIKWYCKQHEQTRLFD